MWLLQKSYPHSIHIVWICEHAGVYWRMVQIYDTDSVFEMAHKIFYQFEVHQSCSIYGYVVHETQQKLYAKGELVWEEIKRIDEEVNCRYDKSGKRSRNYQYKKDSIGGPIAMKIFTKDVKMPDKQPRWTIWRYQ